MLIFGFDSEVTVKCNNHEWQYYTQVLSHWSQYFKECCESNFDVSDLRLCFNPTDLNKELEAVPIKILR
jgi:hypothetical protein